MVRGGFNSVDLVEICRTNLSMLDLDPYGPISRPFQINPRKMGPFSIFQLSHPFTVGAKSSQKNRSLFQLSHPFTVGAKSSLKNRSLSLNIYPKCCLIKSVTSMCPSCDSGKHRRDLFHEDSCPSRDRVEKLKRDLFPW